MKIFGLFFKLKKDTKKRTELFLKLGLTVNLIYALYNIFTGVKYGSMWFYSVAVYYTMICLIKFFLIIRGFAGGKQELLNLRTCGVLLLLLNITVSGLIILMIAQNKHHVYSPWVILWAAGYTVFRLSAAITEGLRLRKTDNPTMRAVKSLNLTVAMMSFFSLQTSILDRMKMTLKTKSLINSLTGGLVSVCVIVIAVETIVRAEKHLRRWKSK